jgi:hypothetical protein
MTPEQLTLYGISITALVTIVGWIYTATVQYRILRETKKSQSLERELAVFRERLTTIRNITSALIERGMYYIELESRIRTGLFDFDKEAAIMESKRSNEADFRKALYDPSFRSIVSLLPEQEGNELNSQYLKTIDSTIGFKSVAGKLNRLTPNINASLSALADQAHEISRQYFDTAESFAVTFAILDKNLAGGNQPKLSIFRRLTNWLKTRGNKSRSNSSHRN